jgi:hypothetical protein
MSASLSTATPASTHRSSSIWQHWAAAVGLLGGLLVGAGGRGPILVAGTVQLRRRVNDPAELVMHDQDDPGCQGRDSATCRTRCLRVSENLPGLLALTDVDSGGPELECSVDLFSVAVVHWTEIEV